MRLILWILGWPIWIGVVLHIMPALNAMSLYANSSGYREAVFIVNGHHSSDGFESGKVQWVTGTINGHNERYIDGLVSRAVDINELIQAYPIETSLTVLYNSDMTNLIRQGETLRVIDISHDFHEDALYLCWYGFGGLFPSMVIIVLLIMIRKSPNQSVTVSA